MTRRSLLLAVLALLPLQGVGAQTGPAVAAAGLAALGVGMEVREVRFSVEGGTLLDARERLDALGPLGPFGPRAHAVTDFHMTPHWRPHRLPDRCVVRGLRIELDIQIRLPEWTGEVQAAAHERMEWADFERAILAHEHAHRDITVQSALSLATSLRALSTSTCPRLVQRVAGVLRLARTELRRAHETLDVRQPRVTHRR